MSSSDFAVFGPGRVGLQLARHLVGLGLSCTAIRGRTLSASTAGRSLGEITMDTWDSPEDWAMPELALVCVGDPEIGRAAAAIAASFDIQGTTVLHTSGLRESDALATCAAAGASVASWHPLQTFPDSTHLVELEGVPCAIEGSPQAVRRGELLALELGMIPWRIEAKNKPLYHAAAAVAGNLNHILVNAAMNLMRDCGLVGDELDQPLRPLIESSIQAALSSPGLDSLTGPIARGDRVAIRSHLEVLPAPLSAAYEALADYVATRCNHTDFD